jgi:hypothetical protein
MNPSQIATDPELSVDARGEVRKSDLRGHRGGGLLVFRRTHRYLAALLVACLLGFAPTYSFVFLTATWMVHVHAFFMMLWMVMLVVQAWSIQVGRRGLHRTVGKLSYLVAPIMLATGIAVAMGVLRRGGDGVTALENSLVSIPLYVLLEFALVYGMAIYYRKRPALHARWMLTSASVSGAGIVRVFLVYFGLPFWLSSHLSDLLFESIFLGLLIKDWRRGFRWSPYAAFLPIHAFQHVLLHVSGEWPLWQRLLALLHG